MASLNCADMRVEIAMMRMPDGHSRLELSRFLSPPVVADHRSSPVNSFPVAYASCSLWRTSTIRSPVSKNAARRSSAKWFSTKTPIGFATSGVPKEFSSGLPKSSGGRLPDEHIPAGRRQWRRPAGTSIQSPQRDQRSGGLHCASPMTGSPPLGPGYKTGHATPNRLRTATDPRPAAPQYRSSGSLRSTRRLPLPFTAVGAAGGGTGVIRFPKSRENISPGRVSR